MVLSVAPERILSYTTGDRSRDIYDGNSKNLQLKDQQLYASRFIVFDIPVPVLGRTNELQ
jgi:hypothetical protein